MPQRIRAGCDAMCATLMLLMRSLPQRIRAGCDGVQPQQARSVLPFATAHSRGLRRQLAVTGHTHVPLPQRIRAGCDLLPTPSASLYTPLPQRIRAGCDEIAYTKYDLRILCHSAFARVATLSGYFALLCLDFATAHSCGLRPHRLRRFFLRRLCHSAFVRVATKGCLVSVCDAPLCHSAFVRVATVTTTPSPVP